MIRVPSPLAAGKVVAFTVALALLAVPARGRAFCFAEAADRYDLPAVLLEIIAEQESGLDPDAAGWNANGTVDVGLMQINSWWEDRLGPRRWQAVCTDPCYNVLTGAWILADCVARYGYTVEGIGCYNAVSPDKRKRYSRRIFQAFLKRLAEGGAGAE